jgi:ppGpp synthetase/RelA/SpoT-type nucleotidyltranferase
MSALEEVIGEAVARFERKRDRYLKLAERVAEVCRVEIIEANAIRAQVTFRVKSVRSLEAKLRRIAKKASAREADFDHEHDRVETLLAGISDFAGVRVATFRTEDEARVVEEIKRRFCGPDGGGMEIENKDRFDGSGFSFYRATHCQAFLLEEELVGTCENLKGSYSEIQVCSMMAQVWNEVEHDIGYKPTGGGPLRTEKNLLRSLGYLARSADEIISALLEANSVRLQEQTGEFQDVFDFVARLRGRFPGADLSRHSGQLFEELAALDLTSPEELKSQIGCENFDPMVAAEKLADFNAFLKAHDRPDCLLDDQSSDLILVLVLDRFAERIEANHPAGRGKGRPPRIRSIATCYREYASGGGLWEHAVSGGPSGASH